MLRIFIGVMLVVVSIVVCPAHARDIDSEPSKFGRFEIGFRGDDCDVTFRSTAGKTSHILTLEYCAVDSLSLPEATETVGAVKLPFLSTGGEEFHLMEIQTLRGGNACDGNDYWAVVVQGERLWTTQKPFGGCAFVERSRVIDEDGKATVSFIVPATTTSEGASYNVSMGQLKTVPLRKLKRTLNSTQTVVKKGKLRRENHATDFKPYIEIREEWLIVDSPGKCKLDDLVREEAEVEVTFEVRHWSDGESEFTCLSVKSVE